MKVFIDGQEGTTGLQLGERLKTREDIQLLEIPSSLRKDVKAKQALMTEADVVFLCLPDESARESAKLVDQSTIVIDASTAHRTNPDWAYGLPELSQKHRAAIANGKRIAVPGCHAGGFSAMVYPLVSLGILSKDVRINCTSLTGYSGGGKQLIQTYETKRTKQDKYHAPRAYALGLTHKHLPEMMAVNGLAYPPHFYPVVGDMYRGMLVTIHLWQEQFNHLAKPLVNLLTEKMTPEKLQELYRKYYQEQEAYYVRILPPDTEAGFLDPTACNDTNFLDISVFGHEEQMVVTARLDNLGKGASGAAVQCMNIALGIDEKKGL